MRRSFLVPLLACLIGAAPASACRLALVLALDVSSSVDAREDRLQRMGLANALTAPEVADALLALPGNPVALSVFEWSGRRQQVQILDWTLLRGPDDLQRAADRILRTRRFHTAFPTALGNALRHAFQLLEIAPRCVRQVVDVSGDGKNNAGLEPVAAYRTLPFDGITVNGLAIGGAEEGVPGYYRDHLIRGPGAFVVTADGFADFERAMRLKLVQEAAPVQLSATQSVTP